MEAEKHTKVTMPNAVLLGEVKQFLREGRRVILQVKGNSMLPFIRGGRDSVELMAESSYGIGDIVLAEIDKGHYVLHRIVAIGGHEAADKVVLMGDGNLRGTEECMRSELVGMVRLILKNGREIDPNTRKERRKAEIWRRLLPVRRWLLAIYKRIR